MAAAAAERLGASLRGGLVVGLVDGAPPAGLELVRGQHPEPGAGSLHAGRRALEIAAGVAPDEELLVLLSGGASALMVVPAEGLTLDDKIRTTRALLRGGADIHTLNTVRKHLSAIKGGWLAAGCRGTVRTLALSDVVGDDVSVIGSGPTVPDASTFTDARQALDRFAGAGPFPPAVWRRLDHGIAGLRPDTPKPSDDRLRRSHVEIVGSRSHAMQGAADRASALGYTVLTIDDPVVGEARDSAARHLSTVLARAEELPRPLCVVSSGETTVTVRGDGRGGRNQEFALALVERLAASARATVAASIGTDGIDGPTDAAGAVVDSTSLNRAASCALAPPERFLARNDAYHFFAPLGDLVHTGPTGTNVGDLQIILLA